MRNIKRSTECEIHLAPDELADVFWAMDAEEQAGFFNRLSEISGGKLAQQLCAIAEGQHLTGGGRYTMHLIGEYAS